MSLLWRVGLFLLSLVFLVGGVVFALQNDAQVTLVLAGWALPAQPIALWILGALLLGGMVGSFVGVSSMVWRQWRRRSARSGMK